MLESAESALSLRVGRGQETNQRMIWEQNSTDIPTVITRLTREIALAWILKRAMQPSMWTRMEPTVPITTSAAQALNPMRRKETKNTAAVCVCVLKKGERDEKGNSRIISLTLCSQTTLTPCELNINSSLPNETNIEG